MGTWTTRAGRAHSPVRTSWPTTRSRYACTQRRVLPDKEGRSVPLDRRRELTPGSSGTIGRPLPAAGHPMHFRTNDDAKNKPLMHKSTRRPRPTSTPRPATYRW